MQSSSGWGADGLERFLFPELRAPGCAPACACRCPTAPRRGPETEAHLQKQVDGEGLNGLTVGGRRDTWPAPERRRNSLALGAPAKTSDFPFLASTN